MVAATFREEFAGRILPFDSDAAQEFAKIIAAHMMQAPSNGSKSAGGP